MSKLVKVKVNGNFYTCKKEDYPEVKNIISLIKEAGTDFEKKRRLTSKLMMEYNPMRLNVYTSPSTNTQGKKKKAK